jgi:RNA polymerase sigma factor (sigma-70 family)
MVMLCPIELEQSQNLNDLMSVLSPREQEVLTYVIKGLTNRYIANKLNITEGTVKKTIYNAYKKLGICSRIELINLVHR